MRVTVRCRSGRSEGKWYLSDFHTSYQKKDAVQLFDGIVIDLATLKVANPEEGEPAEFDRQHYEKLIKQYCKALKELEKLPVPESGDCLFCTVLDPDGKDTSHLISHLEERLYSRILDLPGPASGRLAGSQLAFSSWQS